MWRARWTAGEDPTAYVGTSTADTDAQTIPTPDSMTEIDRALGRVAAEARRAAFKQAKEAIEVRAAEPGGPAGRGREERRADLLHPCHPWSKSLEARAWKFLPRM